MKELNTIIAGNFPAGSKIKISRTLFDTDIFIVVSDGFSEESFSLKRALSDIKILNGSNDPDRLSAIEGGIIGGATDGFDGFLAGYLSLEEEDEGIFVSCKTYYGYSFTAFVSREIYESLVDLN